MGTLKPGATYIYERANGVTYAREAGADPSTRRAIGWNQNDVDSYYRDAITEQQNDWHLWKEIRDAAKTNPALDDLLTQAKMLYNLSKENE